jgi:hypothetical protein
MAESKFTPGPWVAEKVNAANKVRWSIHTEDQFVASTGYLGIAFLCIKGVLFEQGSSYGAN